METIEPRTVRGGMESFGVGTPFDSPPPIMEIAQNSDQERQEAIAKDKKAIFARLEKPLQEIETKLVNEFKSNPSSVHKRRLHGVQEAIAICRGQATRHPAIDELPSGKIMISYSHKDDNEELSRILQLALQEAGMVVWRDNQETNVSVDKSKGSGTFVRKSKPAPKPEPKPKQDGVRGIGVDQDWQGAIDIGIGEGFGVCMLTPASLASESNFAVIAREINRINENKKLVLAFMDDDGSLAKRYEEFRTTSDNEDFQQLPQAYSVSVPTISLSRSQFEQKTLLGNYVIDQLQEYYGVDVPVSRSSPIEDVDRSVPGQQDLAQGIGALKEQLHKERQSADEEDKELAADRIQSVEEAEIIIESIITPEKTADRLKYKKVYFPQREGIEEGHPGLSEMEKLAESFKDLGMDSPIDTQLSERKGTYEFILLSDKIVEGSASLATAAAIRDANYLKDNDESSLYSIWIDGQGETALKAVERHPEAQPHMSNMRGNQAIVTTSEDFNDPDALASYMAMKLAIAEKAQEALATPASKRNNTINTTSRMG